MGAVGTDDRWTILTGHGHVLVEIARDPEARIREIAAAAGITERTASAIISDLERAGYVTRTRVGRRTHYSVNSRAPFRHPAQGGHHVGQLLRVLAIPDEPGDPDTPANADANADAGEGGVA